MNINRNNYEAFLLDLLEGRLSEEEERELSIFLKEHPEHVADMPDVDLFRLEKNAMAYPNRDQLKKEFPTAGSPFSEANFDMYSIARMEGDLSPVQEQEYVAVLEKDVRRRSEWEGWQLTRLKPEKITFPAKQTLKKRNPVRVRRIWLSGLSAAAGLALVFILLRMESTVPGLANLESSDVLPAQEEVVVAQDPGLETQENLPITPEEIPVEEVVGDARPEPGLAMTQPGPGPNKVRTNPGPNEVQARSSLNDIEQETAAETHTQLFPDEIQARPLRIAGSLQGTSAMLAQARSDRIEALPASVISARSSRLPMNEIAEIDRQLLFEEFTRENNISLLSVANAGIKGINKLTGSDISLMASRDEEGDVSGYRLKSKRFSFSRPLPSEE